MVDVSGIKDYFGYIKDIYLEMFDKILTEETKNKIYNYNFDDIIINEEAEFNIKVEEKINYKLDIESFIKNNNLMNENLNCLDELDKKQVKYILENRSNKEKIIKDTLLENSILLFIPKKDILSYGMCTYLGNKLSINCNLNTLRKYYKEEKIIERLIDLLGYNEVLKGILNGNIDFLKTKFNEIDDDKSFSILYSNLQKEFDHYLKNVTKVYYIDSLYNYSNLNYEKYINKIQDVKSKKDEINIIKEKRIDSIVDCLKELERYMIILKEKGKNDLYYSTLNIKRILSKDNALLYFDQILSIENDLKNIVDYIWNYYINFEGTYDFNSNYYFLIQNYNQITNDKFTIMNLITNDHTRVPINKNRYKYGFIYKIKPGAILYSSLDNIIFHETDFNNFKIVKSDGIQLEIDDPCYSKLITPRNLLIKTLEYNKEYNSVLVNQDYIIKSAIYCICNSENDMDYKKASDLASKYDLPLIFMHETDMFK